MTASDDPPPTEGFNLVGEVFEVEAFAGTGEQATEFDDYIAIVIRYTAEDLAKAGVTDPSQLRIWYWDTEVDPPCWVCLRSVVDPVARTVTARVKHLTTFALMVDPDLPALTDVKGHWAETDVLRLASIGAVSGYEDGTFRPELAVTRAQFAKFLAAAPGLKPGHEAFLAAFKDAPAIPSWAVPYMAACVREGVLTGSDGLLRPNDTITRTEAAAMLARALGLGGELGGVLTFTDAGSLPGWALGYIYQASSQGLILGMPDGSFRPSDNLTRARAVTILSGVLNLN